MKKRIININNENYKKIYRRIKYYKYLNDEFVFNYSFGFKYKNDFDKVLKALNMKNKYERYSYIYDEVCDYLDSLFIDKNMCEFADNKCYSNRCKNFEKTCGCCSNNRGVACKYLVDNHCTIKCSGCKFYICPVLKKKRGPIRMKDIPLAYYFLNDRQKIVLRYTVFTPKEEIVDRLVKFRL